MGKRRRRAPFIGVFFVFRLVNTLFFEEREEMNELLKTINRLSQADTKNISDTQQSSGRAKTKVDVMNALIQQRLDQLKTMKKQKSFIKF